MRPDDPRWPMLVARLVAGDQLASIAIAFEVDARTIRRWRSEPHVVAAVDQARNEIVGEARGKLKALVGRIPEALNKALDEALGLDPETGKRVKPVDPRAVVMVCDAIGEKAGLIKVTKVEVEGEVKTTSVNELTAKLLAIREKKTAPQGEQG